MNRLKLITRSLRYYAVKQTGSFLGAMVASAVLIGALVVGDSVRLSLRRLAFLRLGQVDWSLSADDRLFRAALAAELSRETHRPAAAVLSLPAVATAGEGATRANRVQLMGVDSEFWRLAPVPGASPQIPEDCVALNQTLANHLKARVGDLVVLRVHKPSALSRDSLLSKAEDAAIALRLRVSAIVGEESLGRFSLQAGQISGMNAFVPADFLRKKIKAEGKANLLLVAKETDATKTANPHSGPELSAALAKCWKLEDGQLSLLTGSNGTVDLRTSRVFLDSATESAALRVTPGTVSILTYFVNELRSGQQATPYSMVSALPPSLIGTALEDNEILVSKWLADDLNVHAGDSLSMKYFVTTPGRQLQEKEARFRVRGVLEMTSTTLDQGLIPDFPGLTDAENCRDWDAGFPIESGRVREKDEKYWSTYKRIPKAVITLHAGQQMWENRFGKATAVRFPVPTPAGVEENLRRALSPEVSGLVFEPVGLQAVRAVRDAQDFGGLFLGFSMFLIASALLLLALLFRLGLEQRSNEMGVLLAMGFHPREVRNLVLLEGLILVAVAGLAGVLGGVFYARAMILGLATIWNDAVGTTQLTGYYPPLTLFVGWIVSVLVAGGTLWIGIRRFARLPARTLLDTSNLEALDSQEKGTLVESAPSRNSFKSILSRFWAFGALGISTGVFLWAVFGGVQIPPDSFFGLGALHLAGWLDVARRRLEGYSRLSFSERSRIGPIKLAIRNAGRRTRRSLATIAMLACGAFMVISVGVFRLDESGDSSSRKSGTGGFALFGDASLPVVYDLNSRTGREFHNLEPLIMEGVHVVPFRVRDGDEASCLNLNRAQRPRIVGVNPEYLKEVGAFRFAQFAPGYSPASGWGLLTATNLHSKDSNDAVTEVPAIVDQASAQWALGKKTGETLDFQDEKGRPFKVRIVATLANSILQGNLVVSEDAFSSKFPSEDGYRMFLVDVPSNKIDKVSTVLTKNLSDLGVQWQRASSRLESFNAVQNTYLSTFQLLGGLGLVVGCFGLGAVVLRNVFERRGELASLAAFGFSRKELVKLVAWEHVGLLFAGLAIAVCSAAVAVCPSWLGRGEAVLPKSLGYTMLGVLVNGMAWAWVASLFAVRKQPAEVLRDT